MLAQGLTYKQIAGRMGRSTSTVRTHLHKAYLKLGVCDRAQAVLKCEREGWLDSAGVDTTSRVLLRLLRAVEELCRLVEARSKLTSAQRHFLSAFDAVLWARDDDDKVAARESMDAVLGPVLADTNVVIGGRPRRDLVELLVDHIQSRQ